MIENAARGENWMFRNFYAEVSGKEKDILGNGRWSCAVFVSSILYLNKLIGDIHANTGSVEKDMLESGWQVTTCDVGTLDDDIASRQKGLRPGAVLVWEVKIAPDDNQPHSHIGFYAGGKEAISNDSRGAGFPHKHHYTYNGARKIEKIYWHPKLDD